MIGLTTGEWIEVAVAVGTIALAGAAFAQIIAERRSRPDLSLELDSDGTQTRLEGEPPRIPWIRLMVRNAPGRRAARGTRVLVDHYRERYTTAPVVSLAGPELGWPSTQLAEGEGAVVFGGTARPLDFGALGTGPSGGSRGNLLNLMGTRQPLRQGERWWFRFTLAMHTRNLFIGREFLPGVGGGYTARLTVGADDGEAQAFDVHFDWIEDAPTAEGALGSVLISVTPVPDSPRLRVWTFVRRRGGDTPKRSD